MKKYVKPVMFIENALTIDSFMQTATVGGGAGPGWGGPGSGGGDAKERDFEEDMEMLQIIEGSEKKNLW